MRLPHRILIPLLAVAACADPPASDPTPDAAAPAAAPAVAPAVAADFAPGEVIVKLRDGAYDGAAPLELAGRRLVPIKPLPSGTWLMRIDAGQARVSDQMADTVAAIDALAADPAVEAAHPNLAFELSATPNDPEAGINGRQGWSYYQIRMYEAWDRTQGSSNVRIGLIDSGRRNHPDLVGRWAPGFDFIYNDADPTDDRTWAHGTHVAGIVGATANNGVGGAGICWNCPIVPIRVTPRFTTDLNPSGIAYIAELEQAVAWAAGPDGGPVRAEVINFSLNHPTLTSCEDGAMAGLRTQINRAIARGVVVVSSAGNLAATTPNPRPRVPATCPGVISVIASDPIDGVPTYSARGVGADLAAPGGGLDLDMHYGEGVGCPTAIYGEGTNGVFSSWSYPLGGADTHCYRHLSGTSMSAPHVTGTVALMRSVRALTPAQIKAVLRLTASPPQPFFGWGFMCPELNGCGAGRLDANAAIDAVDSGNPVIAEVTPAQKDFVQVSAGAPATQSFSLKNIGFATLTSTGPMRIDGGEWFSFAFPNGTCTSGQTCSRAISLPVNFSFNIPVRCTPSGGGTQTAELIIPSNSVGETRVQLWCTSSGVAQMVVNPTSVGFGDVRVGTTGYQWVTVSNTGTVDLQLYSVGVTGAGYSQIDGFPATIPPTNANNPPGSIRVRCNPTTPGQLPPGRLTINSNSSSGGVVEIPLSCKGVSSIISATPNPLAFGNVRVGTSLSLGVTVRNTGTAPLNIASAVVTGTGFSLDSSPTGPIAPGGTGTAIVKCTPPSVTDFSGQLAITSDGGNVNVGLTCRGVESRLSVNPTFLAFGTVRVGSYRDLNLTVSNLGDAPLNIPSAMISGPGYFLILPPPPSLPPHGNAIVTVRFAPPFRGNFPGTLAFVSDGGSVNVGLLGTGVAPILTPSTSLLQFGDVRVGASSSQNVGLTNTGDYPLTITSIVVSGPPFSAGPVTTPFVIAPGSTFQLPVRCGPTARGDFRESLTVASDGGTGGVTLRCRGVGPVLSAPSSLAFPGVLLGFSSTASLPIANTGEAPLSIRNAFVTGSDFSLETPPPGTITPTGSATVTLRCTPATPGYKQGTLTLVHDGASSPTTIQLGCLAAYGRIEVIEPTGQLDVAPGRPGYVLIRNTGTGPLNIDALEFTQPGFAVEGVTLPTTVAAGDTLSWWVTCSTRRQLFAKHFAKHDGLDSGSLFGVTCNGQEEIPGPDPVPVLELE